MNRRGTGLTISLTAACALAAFAARALAEGIPSPNAMYYSGTLSEGGQLVDGTRSLTVNIWANATSLDAPLCSSAPFATVSVVSGQFRIPLPNACKTAVNANNNAYVEVLDGTTSLGRTAIGAVPYSVEADHAVNADNAANATNAAGAGHAVVADNATSALSASSLATGASGGLTHYGVPGNALTAPCGIAFPGSTVVDCSCPPGSYVTSGGGYVNPPGYLRESRSLSASTWRVTCASGGNDVMCGQYSLLCSRLGP
jgi:hypothetical protein